MSNKTTTLSFRINEDVKKQFEKTCEAMGLSASDALNIFVKKVISEQAIPFDVKAKIKQDN